MALALPSQAADELDRVVAPLRPAWPGLRWTGRDAWHLTLSFLGEVDESLTGRLAEGLAHATAKHSRLPIRLRGAGAFPTASRARVLWTGVEVLDDRGGMRALARSVRRAARDAGIPPAEKGRKYQPHLTLARCRAPIDVRSLRDELRGYQGTPWVADEVYLIRSHLGPHPRYETLGTWILRSDEPDRTGR